MFAWRSDDERDGFYDGVIATIAVLGMALVIFCCGVRCAAPGTTVDAEQKKREPVPSGSK